MTHTFQRLKININTIVNDILVNKGGINNCLHYHPPCIHIHIFTNKYIIQDINKNNIFIIYVTKKKKKCIAKSEAHKKISNIKTSAQYTL